MPCYTRREISVSLENRNPKTLAKALESMGYSVRFIGDQINFSGRHKESGVWAEGRYINGSLSYSGTVDVKAVKRAYAGEVVKKQFGTIGKITTVKAGSKYLVQAKV